MQVPDDIRAAYDEVIEYASDPRTRSGRKFHEADDRLLCLIGKLVSDHRDEINALLAKEAGKK